MPFDSHENARLLIDRSAAAGLSKDEQSWLHDHMEACTECTNYAQASARMIQALQSFSFETDAAMSVRVRHAVLTHARQLAGKEPGFWDVSARAASRLAERISTRPLRWVLVASLTLAVLAIPVYRSHKASQRQAETEKQDALLLERVDAELSREVPVAMEPLVPRAPQGTNSPAEIDKRKNATKHGGVR